MLPTFRRPERENDFRRLLGAPRAAKHHAVKQEPGAPRGICIDDLRKAFAYEPATGALTWQTARPGISAGQRAGTVVNGHWILSLHGVKFSATRAIYAMMTGEWPQKKIYAADSNPLNLMWDNLNGDQEERCRDAASLARHRLRKVNSAVWSVLNTTPAKLAMYRSLTSEKERQAMFASERAELRRLYPDIYPDDHLTTTFNTRQY